MNMKSTRCTSALECARQWLRQEWSRIPLPPEHCRADTWLVAESAAAHWESAWKRGPEPPSVDFPRWWNSSAVVIDVVGTIRSKSGAKSSQMPISRILILDVQILVWFDHQWRAIPAVLKSWVLRRVPKEQVPLWPRIPKPWAAILGSALFAPSLYLAHSHHESPTGTRYCTLLTVRAQNTLHHYLSAQLLAPLHHSIVAQTHSFLAQVLFCILPRLRTSHLFQHNDLKLDNLVYVESSGGPQFHDVRLVSHQWDVWLRIPTYGKHVAMIDMDHASFAIEPHHPSFCMADHPNSFPLQLVPSQQKSARDWCMLLLSIPQFQQWPDITIQKLCQRLFGILSSLSSISLHSTTSLHSATSPSTLSHMLYTTLARVPVSAELEMELLTFARHFQQPDVSKCPTTTPVYHWELL